MKIVGLTGHFGAGKKTVAGRLWAAHGFEQMSFMDPVWETLHAADAVDLARLHEPGYLARSAPRLNKSPLQLAADIRRWGLENAPDFWLRVTKERVEAAEARGARAVVILDMVDDNEATWTKAAGGQVWRIVRPTWPGIPVFQNVSAQHIDLTLINDRGIETLHTHVDTLAERLLSEVTA